VGNEGASSRYMMLCRFELRTEILVGCKVGECAQPRRWIVDAEAVVRDIKQRQIIAQILGSLPQEERGTIHGRTLEQELGLVAFGSQRKCQWKRFIDPKEGQWILTSGSLGHSKEKIEAHALAERHRCFAPGGKQEGSA